jgi:hypothetical protein
MIKITADSDSLNEIEMAAKKRHPTIHFSGNIKAGFLQIELDRNTAEFVIMVVNALKASGKKNPGGSCTAG